MNEYRVVTIKYPDSDIHFVVQRRYNWFWWEKYMRYCDLSSAIRDCKRLEFPVKPLPPKITQVYP